MARPWYQTAIIYGIDVTKFADSNGDGIGDFPGLTSRLDYLEDLGIDCIWLLPFYPSPRRDNGYDVTDYYSVDPRLGTLEDFIAFVESARERGIRVIVDLVTSHTSDEHPWFMASRRDPASRFRNYYVWAEEPPELPDTFGRGSAFPGEEESPWTYDPVARAYYYHPFYEFQPCLNAEDPDVVAEIERIIDFWLSLGIAGFRMDAVPLLLGLEGPRAERPTDPHAILKRLRDAVQSRHRDAAFLGEVDVEPPKRVEYFGEGDGLNMLLDFFLNNFLFLALAKESKEPILHAIEQLPPSPPCTQWVNFLRNLDELNISWLPEAERDFVWDRFAPEPDMRIYGRGIRRRLAPMLDGDRRKLELCFSLMFSLPGTPMLVYGDEIGMGEDLRLPGRDAVRTPMQWSGRRNAGFSLAPEERLIRPVVSSGPFDYRIVNVERESADRASLMHWVRRLIRVRKKAPEISYGRWSLIDTASPAILATRFDWQDCAVLVAHNLSGEEARSPVDMTGLSGRTPTRILGEGVLAGADGCDLTLPPYGYGWWSVECSHRRPQGG